MSNIPLVSVLMITYKHEEFLAQAIHSIMAQQTGFGVQLLVGDDLPSEISIAIGEGLAKQYPERVLYFKRTKNLGVQPNFVDLYNKTEGSKYLAVCEGDDFWIDPLKLQKQVDFLEQNEDFALCFHETEVQFFDKKEEPYLLNENLEKDVFTIKDLIGEDEIWFMATASTCYRREAVGAFPDWFLKSKSGDIPMHILTARNGKIKFLNEKMGVYRKHSGGHSLTDHTDDEAFLRNRIMMYSELNRETGYEFNQLFRKNIARYYRMMLDAKQYQASYFRRLGIALKYLDLASPSQETKQEIIKDYIVPKWTLDVSRFIKKKLGLIPENN
jgi:glycosyltransferase involved in cell wall biosynthesis